MVSFKAPSSLWYEGLKYMIAGLTLPSVLSLDNFGLSRNSGRRTALGLDKSEDPKQIAIVWTHIRWPTCMCATTVVDHSGEK